MTEQEDREYWLQELERFELDTVVQCQKCGHTEYLLFINGLKHGWSRCHGLTMPIVFCIADIGKVVKKLVDEARESA